MNKRQQEQVKGEVNGVNSEQAAASRNVQTGVQVHNFKQSKDCRRRAVWTLTFCAQQKAHPYRQSERRSKHQNEKQSICMYVAGKRQVCE